MHGRTFKLYAILNKNDILFDFRRLCKEAVKLQYNIILFYFILFYLFFKKIIYPTDKFV